MGSAEGNSESHTKSVAWGTEFRARTAARRTSAHTSSEGIWRGKVGVRIGLRVPTKRCGPSTLAVAPLFPWGLRVQSSYGDGLTAVVKLSTDRQRL